MKVNIDLKLLAALKPKAELERQTFMNSTFLLCLIDNHMTNQCFKITIHSLEKTAD
jgi:hypothetical protein